MQRVKQEVAGSVDRGSRSAVEDTGAVMKWGWEESKAKSLLLLTENLGCFSHPSTQSADNQTGNGKILF